ncbi:MAG: hypothetical protein P9L93_07865 [Candidatus Gorgyraea atricola]|nr:hypothetical protein [Candidatus Gorgyraea atricola]
MKKTYIIFCFIAILLISGFKYDIKAKRDPFIPLISKDGMYVSDAYGITSIKDIRLEGIVWDEANGSIAIINGEIAEEGQKIGIVKVLKIEKGAVVFEVEGDEVRVELVTD